MRSELRYAPAALLALLLALAPCAAASGTAPDFIIRECVHADSIMLSDHLDGPVLLAFYDGGFVTNIYALNYAKEWDRRYEVDGLTVIAIHSPLLEPSRIPYNAIEIVGMTGALIPVGLDMEREVCDLYGISELPAFVLIRPGGEIAAALSGEQVYADVERAVQDELKRINPDIVLPLVSRPLRPRDDPEARMFPATPIVRLGYEHGQIANAESSLHDVFGSYQDYRDRDRDVVFLNGKWKVGEDAVAYSDSLGGHNNYIRIIYRAKSVYILPEFELGGTPRIYVKQDRSYLDKEAWGKGIMGDQQGRPYLRMSYSIPYQIVDNPSFGVHQLELIPAEDDVSVYYLFFESDVQK